MNTKPTHEKADGLRQETPRPYDRQIAGWLFSVAAMVFAMVVIGGLTRLTESGLSMTDWRPVTGWLPPMSDAEWQRVFDGYRQIPEYQQINAGMSLDEFKDIFWLEYIHRLWGRLIGLAFFVPFVWFVLRGAVDRRLGEMLTGLLLLGALQGAIGWYMVSSGLSERTDVSQYRLALHLGIAIVIYIALLRLGLWLGAARRASQAGPWRTTLRGLLGAVFVTIIAGAFVAGTNAGFTYNTFPLMDGDWVPRGLYDMDPFWLAAFEDITTIQFNHRLLATVTALVIVIAFWQSMRTNRLALKRLLGGAVLATATQYVLGVATLISIVRIDLATLHQAGAMVLVTILVIALARAGELDLGSVTHKRRGAFYSL